MALPMSVTITIVGASGSYRLLGRVNPATKELSWPGSGLEFSFTGSSASIALTSVIGTNSVDITIDNGQPIVVSNVEGSSCISTGNLLNGPHMVTIRKRSEALFGSLVVGSVTTVGTAGIATSPSARKIQIIGDSITIGYGLDGTAPCTNTAVVEDNPLTYAALAAKSLKADYNVVVRSGIGLTRNYATAQTDTSPLNPELFSRYGANDADGSYKYPAAEIPGAVVINLGINDFSYLATDANGNSSKARDPIKPSAFTTAMVKFLKSLQTHWPNAQFFLLSSPLPSDCYPSTADAQHTTESNALKVAVNQIGAKAHFVDCPTQGSAAGCDYHPNAATNTAESSVLASAISSALGWH